MQRLFEHGGDIKSAMRAFPGAHPPWIDLSTGLNPVGYPMPDLSAEVWSRLPEPSALEALQAAAGSAYGAEPERIAAAAGTQALLQILPRLFPTSAVSIVGPTYGEFERAWKAAGVTIEIVSDLDAATAAQVVVANPNNPDGRMVSRRRLSDTAHRLSRGGRRLIVDEAFMDFEAESVAGERLPATIVLRSFGKAYGLAGLRLGFAIAPPEDAAKLRVGLGPWPVSGPAIVVGTQALADQNWRDAARRRLEDDARWLDKALVSAGFEIVGRTRLFRLGRRPAPPKFSRGCARKEF